MIEVQSLDLRALALGAKEFPKPLRSAVRKSLKGVANEGAQAAKAKILGMPSKGHSGGSNLRSDIAAAIKVAPSVTAGRGAQIRVRVAMSPALAAHRRFRVAQLLDKGKPFRHPYFGEWVDNEKDQQPFPYFRSTMYERAPAMRAAMQASLLEAISLTIPNVR